MKFDSIRIRDIHPFASVDLDLAAIPGTVVAITGPNGAGKTTLCELLAAGLYRATPTRGSLGDLARGRKSTLEVGFTNGASHTLRHVIDSESGKGESFVFDASGATCLNDTKLRSFDAWAASHLPTSEVLYASTFGVQGSGGFLEMTSGDRKGVLLRALGIERLEAMSKEARERASEANGVLATAEGKRASLAGRIVSVAAAKMLLDEASALVASRNAARLQVASALEDLKLLSTSELERAAEARRVEAERADLDGRLFAAQDSLEATRTRIANNQRLVGDRARIEGAIARVEEIRAAQAVVRAQEAKLEAERAVHTQAVVTAVAAESAANTRAIQATAALAKAKSARSQINGAIELAKEVEDRWATVEAHRLREEGLHTLRAAAEQEVRETRAILDTGVNGRIVALRTGVKLVASVAYAGADHAADMVLSDDDKRQAALSEAQQNLPALEAKPAQVDVQIRAERALLGLAQLSLSAAESAAAIAAKAPELDAAIVEAEAALTLAETAQAEACAARREVERRDPNDMAAVREALSRLSKEAASLESTVALHPKLLAAEERIVELSTQEATLAADIAALTARIGALPAVGSSDEPAIRKRLDEAQVALDKVESDFNGATAEHATRKFALATAERDEEAMRAIELEVQAAAAEVSEWRRLGDDLGRDGLQALEIDAAGPELTATVNELLRASSGSRWTVSIEMERQLANGKAAEGCEVNVTDNESGASVEAARLSGGQKVIIGNAVSLALALLACRRSGAQDATIIRDESGAALDAENSRGYVQMLRKAAELAGASRVLLVTHDEAVAEMADARIDVRDGKVTVLS